MSTDKNFDCTQLNVNHEEDKHEAALSGAATPVSVANPDILRRPKRKKRRAKEDRGLPSDEELDTLVRIYLERQRDHWPKMAEVGLLPEPSGEVVREMADDFKARHRGGAVDVEALQVFQKFCSELGGNYNRFSCDNSDPLSIVDQMSNVLRKAQERGQFIPWSYIFCDYRVSGQTANRQGYRSYKAIIQDPSHLMQDTYIDDFTRAGRDMEEWLKFARISKRMKRGIIGVSDGFDLDSHDGKMKIGMFGTLSDMQTQGLREKVKRGMKGAVSRGTCIGKLALGFTRQICRDDNGNIIYRPDGRPRHKPCIDPETSPYRREVFELFVHKNWSLGEIARQFNKLKVDGSNGWTAKSIKKLLLGRDAIGIFDWGHQHREYDRDVERYVVIQNPQSECVVHEAPELAIVPKSLWVAAQEKLEKQRKAHPMTGKKWSKNQKSATTLFSGTLFCQHCDSELLLTRSDGKYKSMVCPSGSIGTHGCKLTTSKSTTIIEKCLLGYIEDFLLTESVIKDLVRRANVFFKQEARKPQVDTAPMKVEVRKKQAAIKMYFERIEKNLGKPVCEEYEERIGKLRTEIDSLKETIREAEVHNGRPLKPLDFKQVKAYLADLRMLLNQEIPMAAEAIRTLTGPIKIRQEKIPGKRGARWIASFSPNLLAILQEVAGDKGSPLAESFQAVPSDLEPVEVFVEEVPKYEELAPEFKKMRDDGASVQAIASAHGMSWGYTNQILEFADTGKRPDWGDDKRQRPKKEAKKSDTSTPPGFGNPTKYIEIAPEVSRLRDKKVSFAKIAARLEVGEGTVRRSYDHLNPEVAREATENATQSKRGSYSHLDEKVFKEVRNLLRAGVKVKEIADRTGCSKSTVYRVRRQMNAEGS